MDLPSCPACNQSVLDDDAAHCPFCGASLSGDGSSVSVPQRPTTQPTSDGDPLEPDTASEPDISPGAATPDNSSGGEAEAEADPFAIAPPISRSAIRTVPKPTKKRSWRVRCPMCDTPGFLPRQAAGQDVKCSNPQCLVPIFTAPASTSAKPDTPPPITEPQPRGGKGPLVVLLLILVAGAGGGAWWFFGRLRTTPPGPALTTPGGQLPQVGDSENSKDRPLDATADRPTKTESSGLKTVDSTQAITTQDIRDRAPQIMIAAAQQRDRNRSKPFCRRLTAEYFSGIGQEQAALAELKQLTQIGKDLPHLHVTALVNLWWHHNRGGTASPGPRLSEAVQRSAKITTNDPFAVDVAVSLGCALIASQQVPLADSTIARLWSPTLTARLQLDQLWCRHTRSFQLANRRGTRPSLRGAASVDSLIIAQLCDRGFSDAALSWARGASQHFDRSERLAAWATAVHNHSPDTTSDNLTAAVASEDPAIQAVVFARLALDDALAQRQESAALSISRTRQALQQCVAVRTVTLGDLKQTFQLPIDDVSGWWMKVRAQAELIGAFSLLGQNDDARQLLSDALATARSLGPARGDIAARLKAIQSLGSAGLIQRIQSGLGITGNDEAQQAAQQYTKKCQDWLQLAERRADCLDRLHRWAISHGLGESSWKDIRDHGLTTDAADRDPFITSTLPSFLYLNFRATGNTSATDEMNRTLQAGLPIDVTEALRQTTRAAIAKGNLATVTQAIIADSAARRDRTSRHDRRRVLFELVGLAAVSKTPELALQLIRSSRNPQLAIWRENAYLLVAAQLASRGQHDLAWNFAIHNDREPTERVALLTGLLLGISARTSPPTPAP